MKVSLVVAVAENGVIGSKGRLPWRMSSDLKEFRRLTMGKPLIMGRKTFVSIGKPLDGRDTIVLTRDAHFAAEGVHVVCSMPEALETAGRLAAARGVDEIMVVGGVEVFRAALPFAHRVYLTVVHARPDGDTFFSPDIELREWREKAREAVPRGPRDDHSSTRIVLERDAA
jgi:dihydrofolate reductase